MERLLVALTKTLAQIRAALKIRAGMNTTGTSVTLTSDVLNDLINDAIVEGYDVITGKWLDYYTKSSTTPLVSGTEAYQVPTDFYKLRRVWIQDGTRWHRLLPIDLDAAHEYTGLGAPSVLSGYRYRLMARDLIIAPTPTVTNSIKLFYIAIPATLSSDSDSITFDVPQEYKFILATAWRDILDMQNLDPRPALEKMQQYEAKLRTAADSRDAGEPFYLNPHGPVTSDDWEDVL